MASVTVGNITFTGVLFTTPGNAHTMGWNNLTPTQIGHAAWCIRHRDQKGSTPQHDALWLIAPEFSFNGIITATGGTADQMKDWSAGLIQSIIRSDRNAEYAGGNHKKFRFDTQFGSVKDGQGDSLFYVDENEFKPTTQTTFTAEVSESDMPNFETPLEFSGNVSAPFGGQLNALERTSGRDEFVSFLAAVHKPSHTIVTLGKSEWAMSWAGTFNTQQRVWTPTTIPVFTLQTADQGAKHENITTATSGNLPFSIFMEEAEQSAQVWDPQQNGWRSSDAKGRPDDHARNLRRWTD
jgi:hypothetical protein